MNQLRKTGVMLAFLLVLVVGLTAVASAEVKVEGDAYVGVFNKYLWRGFDLSGGKSVAQGGVDLSANGFTLSYWSNLQLKNDANDDYASGEMNETDIILDYVYDVNEQVSVSVGNALYALDGPDTNEAYLKVALKTLLNPEFTVYWDWDEAQKTGLFYLLKVGHDIELSEKLSLSLSASASYNQKSDFLIGDYSDWHNAEFGLGLDYSLTDQISLSPSVLYSSPLSNKAKDLAEINNETSVGLTATFSF